MKIDVVAVGKLKEKYLKEGISEYLKRLKPFVKLEITEVADEPPYVFLLTSDAKSLNF